MPLKEIEVASLESDQPPQHAAESDASEGWTPDLNPTQQKIFDDPSMFVAGHGEKGSGKSIGFGHKIIRHCYENNDALAMIITPSIRTGAEGIWHDLTTLIIPQWVEGIGLACSEAKLDPNTKDRHIWIGNIHGGWSKILLISIPYCSQVEARVKGPAPSFVYVDELTNCDGPEYFTFTSAQLGRRRGVSGPQQWCASFNPKGKKHWVYKTFFVDCIDQTTGERDRAYAVYHVPISENKHRLPAGYYERLERIFKSDPIERRRLLEGEWIDRPSGEAIFKEFWLSDVHVKGEQEKKTGLIPIKGFPVYVGHDPGPVNYSIHFIQMVPTEEGKDVARVFDEINYVKKTKGRYDLVVAHCLRRMEFWSNLVDFDFKYEHISDSAAFSRMNPDGKYDNAIIENLSVDPETGAKRIKLKPCPKGADSVPARVRLIMSMLQNDALFVSAMCPKTKEMFEYLESEKVPEGKDDSHAGFRPQRSDHIHVFDSLSYPIFYASLGKLIKSTSEISTEVYTAGR